MRALVLCLTTVASLGCNQVLGLDPPRLADGGPVVDAKAACGDPSGSPDEDGDGFRDECDNCPHVKQSGDSEFKDSDGDLIGAACDPHDGVPDRVVAFYTFADPVPGATLHTLADPIGGTWAYVAGELRAQGTTPGTDLLARLDVALAGVTIDADVTLPDALPLLASGATHSVGVWADVLPPPGNGSYDPTFPPGVVLEAFEANGAQLVRATHLVDTATNASDETNPEPELFAPSSRFRLVLTCEGDGMCVATVYRNQARVGGLQVAATSRVGSVGLRSYGIDARFHHLMVYAPM